MISGPFDRSGSGHRNHNRQVRPPQRADSLLAMRALSRVLLLVGGSLVFAMASGQALANDSIAGLAPPGPCAEPREAVTGVGESSFSVVGPVAALLNPVDVAAPNPLSPGLGPPVSPRRARPGPCDGPDTSCGQLGFSSPGSAGTANTPIIPGSRPGGRVK